MNMNTSVNHKNLSPQDHKKNDSRSNCSDQNPSNLRDTILLIMYSNAQVHDDPDLQRLQSKCNLHNTRQTNPALSTYIGSEARRINHMFICSQLIKSVTRSGSLSYLDGPQSKHWGLFADINPNTTHSGITFDKATHLSITLKTPQIRKSRIGWLSQINAQVLRGSQHGQANPEAVWHIYKASKVSDQKDSGKMGPRPRKTDRPCSEHNHKASETILMLPSTFKCGSLIQISGGCVTGK